MPDVKTTNAIGLKLIIIVLIGILGAGVYFGIFSKEYGVLAQNKLNQELQLQINQLQQQQTKIVPLQKQLQSEQSQVDNLMSLQLELEAKLKLLQPNDKLLLIELNTLLNLANQNLITYNNRTNAINLLSLASQALAVESNPRFESLDVSIKNDINRLQQSNFAESTLLVNNDIEALNNLLLKLDGSFKQKNIIVVPTKPNLPAESQVNGGKSRMSTFWDDIKQALSTVVKVTKTSPDTPVIVVSKPLEKPVADDNAGGMDKVNPEQGLLLINLLRIALITHNQSLWTANLGALAVLVQLSYAQSIEFASMLELINQLKRIDVTAIANENINSTLQILNNLK